MNDLTLITGHPRSGTGYISKVVQALGKDLPHEKLGADGMVSWLHITSGKMVAKWFPENVPKISFDTILHQIRNPFKVITSCRTIDPGSFDYMGQFCYVPDSDDPFVRAMYSFIGWNSIIEQRRDWYYRIEDFEAIFEEFCFRLGLKDAGIPDIPKNVNTRGTFPTLTWDDLQGIDSRQADRVYEFAEKYKYV